MQKTTTEQDTADKEILVKFAKEWQAKQHKQTKLIKKDNKNVYSK